MGAREEEAKRKAEAEAAARDQMAQSANEGATGANSALAGIANAAAELPAYAPPEYAPVADPTGGETTGRSPVAPIVQAGDQDHAEVNRPLDFSKQKKKKKGAAPTYFGVKGSTAGAGLNLTPEDNAFLAAAAEQRLAADKARGYTTLNTSLALEQSYRQFEDIANDPVYGEPALRRLIDEKFPKFERAAQQLEDDIDAARRLEVDPNNFMRSIGRSGRVSSSLMVGLSQLASGAGNPNSVLARVSSAIERDIDAQKFNIQNKWVGVEASADALNQNMDMLKSQFAFMDQARAVAWAAVEAQAGRIKQHATSEMTYIATQMLETEAEARRIAAKAAAFDALSTIYVDAELTTEHQALQFDRRMRQAAADMRNKALADQGVDPRSGAAVPDLGGIDTLDGQNFDASTQVNRDGTISGAPEQAVSSTEAAPAAAPAQAQAPTSSAARVSRRRKPSAGVSAPQPDQTTPPTAAPPETAQPAAQDDSGPVVDETADRLASPLSNEAVDTMTRHDRMRARLQDRAARIEQEKKPGVTISETTPALTKFDVENIAQDLGKSMKYGSYAGWQNVHHRGNDGPGAATGIVEGLQHIYENPLDVAVFDSIEDAQIAAKYLPPPNPNLPEGERKHYLAKRAHLRKFPELLLQPQNTAILDGDGHRKGTEVTHLRNTAYGDFVLLASADHLRTDSVARNEIKTEIAKVYQTTSAMRDAADLMEREGLGSVLGWRVTPDGFEWTPASEEDAALAHRLEVIMSKQSFRSIKELDSSGRMSEGDQKIGAIIADFRRELGKIGTKVRITYDMFNQRWNKMFPGEDPPQPSAMRRGATRFYATMAAEVERNMLEQTVGGDVVLPFAAEAVRKEEWFQQRAWTDDNRLDDHN